MEEIMNDLRFYANDDDPTGIRGKVGELRDRIKVMQEERREPPEEYEPVGPGEPDAEPPVEPLEPKINWSFVLLLVIVAYVGLQFGIEWIRISELVNNR